MSREWKPGDVARIEYGGGFDDIAVRIDPRDWAVPAGTVRDANVTDARPLVAIDPEDRDAVERLWQAWRDLAPDHRLAQDNLQAALREFANPKPPRPDEPQGLGAVVEDEDGHRWVRTDPATVGWTEWDRPVTRTPYSRIAAVRVLSPGVEVS